MNYKLSTKLNGQWRTIGTLKTNQYGNLQAGFKKSPEMIEWFNSAQEGQWLNLSAFEDKPKVETYEDSDQSPPF